MLTEEAGGAPQYCRKLEHLHIRAKLSGDTLSKISACLSLHQSVAHSEATYRMIVSEQVPCVASLENCQVFNFVQGMKLFTLSIHNAPLAEFSKILASTSCI